MTTSSRLAAAACALLLALATNARAEDKSIEGVVVRVSTGDTLFVQAKGEKKWTKVRLAGLDAPAKATRDKEGQEPWGTRAQQFLSLLATRKEVKVEFDNGANGGERLGYLWVGEKLANEELLREGHALLTATEGKYADRLKKAETAAKTAKRGVWDADEPLPEAPSKFLAKKQDKEDADKQKEGALTLAKWEKGWVIGNSKTKVYHVPGSRYYESSKDSKNAIFFKSAADAEKAGYRKAAR